MISAEYRDIVGATYACKHLHKAALAKFTAFGSALVEANEAGRSTLDPCWEGEPRRAAKANGVTPQKVASAGRNKRGTHWNITRLGEGCRQCHTRQQRGSHPWRYRGHAGAAEQALPRRGNGDWCHPHLPDRPYFSVPDRYAGEGPKLQSCRRIRSAILRGFQRSDAYQTIL